MPWKLNLGVTKLCLTHSIVSVRVQAKQHMLNTKYFIQWDQLSHTTGVQPGRGRNFGS